MTITPTKHPEITPFRWFVWLLSCAFAGMQATAAAEPGLDLTLRRLVESPGAPNPWEVKEQRATWDPNRTAVVVCDMWNAHWCKGATARVAEMAPRMNSVLNALRQRGVLILHCPSETMSFYKDHPGRKLAQSAPKVDVQAQLQACASHTRQEDLAHPIDSSDGGCDCQPQCPQGPYPWTREIATLEIKDGDAITDSVEAYYLMRQRGITNALIMGVHENMCVLNRAFAIKQMVRLGQNIALMRDLTDTMYNSRHPPFVDHFIGNDLMTWHIEKYWCPTVTSDQILGGQPFHFAADKSSPRVFHNEAPRLSRIRVAVDHRTFETETGRPFVPFGVTYFHPDTGWAPQVWKKFDPAATAQDFARLRALGANCARVFISYGSFLSETNAPDPAGLAKFDQFLALAEAAGLYVHPTGPDHWEGTPSWAHGDRIADEVMLGALENFWRVFAARYRDRPALFAYDLRNEPEVAWDTPVLRKKWKKWLLVKHGSEAKAAEFLGVNAELLRGDDAPPPEAKEAPGDTRLLAYQHFREDIADTWTRRQVAAIKAADPKALVTVGLIQWSVPSVLPAVKHYAGFSPKRQAPLLDFMEVHFYPLEAGFYDYTREADETRNLAYLESVVREVAACGKPVVVAEFGWYGGGKLTLDQGRHPPATGEQQARWCRRLVETTRGLATGWLNWGFYDHPEAGDVTQLTGLLTHDGQPKPWAREFQALAASMQGKVTPPAKLGHRPALDWDRCITSLKAAQEFRAEYLKAFQADR